MNNYLKIFIAMMLAVMLINPVSVLASVRVLPDSRTLGTNCDPNANPDLDSGVADPNLRSCYGQNIDATEYQVLVDFANDICDGREWVTLGDEVNICGIFFEFRPRGDKGCVHAHPGSLFDFFVNRSGVSGEVPSNGGVLPNHCYYLPEPRPLLRTPQWSPLVSQACFDYDASQSRARHPFTAVVMRCIEETVLNIFVQPGLTGRTIFQTAQDELVSAIQALLALYIIFTGYKFFTAREVLQGGEWLWIGLRIALVLFFAAGTGMVQLYPAFLSFTRSVSLFEIEAGFGTGDDIEEAGRVVEEARFESDQARRALVLARVDLATDPDNEILLEARDRAILEVRAAEEALSRAMADVDSFGYNYCDFRDFDYSYVNQAGELVENSHARIWDIIDCKVSKYLGIGDNPDNLSAPQALIIAVATIENPLIGLPIILLTLIFLIFLIAVVVRMVHIYIIAFIAVTLLVYISPLIIPAILFQYTKVIFDRWFKQLVAYIIQPIVLFAFLSFVFAVFDSITYGGNHFFYTIDSPEVAGNPDSPLLNQMILNADGTCADPERLGCFYRTVGVTYELRENVIASTGRHLAIDTRNLGWPEGGRILFELLKIILACFIVYAVLDKIEELSAKITNAADSASNLSVTPKLDPQNIGEKLTKGAVTAVGAPGQVIRGGVKAHGVGKALFGKKEEAESDNK